VAATAAFVIDVPDVVLLERGSQGGRACPRGTEAVRFAGALAHKQEIDFAVNVRIIQKRGARGFGFPVAGAEDPERGEQIE
jgi:hypothetical protein